MLSDYQLLTTTTAGDIKKGLLFLIVKFYLNTKNIIFGCRSVEWGGGSTINL